MNAESENTGESRSMKKGPVDQELEVIERQLIHSISQIRKIIESEKMELRQKIGKLEEQLSDKTKELERIQRRQIMAANAEAKAKSQKKNSVTVPMLNDLKKKTGLTSKEINKALDLMKELAEHKKGSEIKD